ncbi:DUF2721 domain-containing protein [Methylomagnum sp.]
MQCQSLAQFTSILQTAIGPALLISGVGLLLLAMTNRLNHVTNRVRSMASQRNPIRAAPATPKRRNSPFSGAAPGSSDWPSCSAPPAPCSPRCW